MGKEGCVRVGGRRGGHDSKPKDDLGRHDKELEIHLGPRHTDKHCLLCSFKKSHFGAHEGDATVHAKGGVLGSSFALSKGTNIHQESIRKRTTKDRNTHNNNNEKEDDRIIQSGYFLGQVYINIREMTDHGTGGSFLRSFLVGERPWYPPG